LSEGVSAGGLIIWKWFLPREERGAIENTVKRREDEKIFLLLGAREEPGRFAS